MIFLVGSLNILWVHPISLVNPIFQFVQFVNSSKSQLEPQNIVIRFFLGGMQKYSIVCDIVVYGG